MRQKRWLCWLTVAVSLWWGHPARAGEVLPPVDEVLRQLVARAESANSGKAQRCYLGTKQTVSEQLDSAGRVTNRKVRVRETRSQPSGAVDANKWSSNNGINLREELLSRYQFKIVRREILHGRPTFCLTFAAKERSSPGFRPQDRLLNRATGTLWVDEAEHELVQVTITLSEPVSFGILGAVDALNFGFERARADDGTWLTQWIDTYFKGRKFLIPVQTRKRVDWSEFKPLTDPLPIPATGEPPNSGPNIPIPAGEARQSARPAE